MTHIIATDHVKHSSIINSNVSSIKHDKTISLRETTIKRLKSNIEEMLPSSDHIMVLQQQDIKNLIESFEVSGIILELIRYERGYATCMCPKYTYICKTAN